MIVSSIFFYRITTTFEHNLRVFVLSTFTTLVFAIIIPVILVYIQKRQ